MTEPASRATPGEDPAAVLVGRIRQELAAHADPVRAEQQQAYMKSAMPFRGLGLPQVRAVVRPLIAAELLLPEPEWLRAVQLLWDDAEFREERYAALEVVLHRRYRAAARHPERLELYEHLVRTSRWWDLVDAIAVHCVGPIVLQALRARDLAGQAERPTGPAGDGAEQARDGAEQTATVLQQIRQWTYDDDLWVRRTAILCQNKFRAETDPELLAETIDASISDPDFFARKAIGWALREYSATEPDRVRAFVSKRPEISSLSRKEALRKLPAD